MSFPWFVAFRYLTARRRQAFISLISAVSVLGVAVGVMALVIALALMTGMQTELRDRIVGSTAHVYVNGKFADADRERWIRPGVVGASPAILGYGLLRVSGRTSEFAMLKGIDPAHEPDVTDIGHAMRSGTIEALSQRSADQKDGVLLGDGLAHTLGVEVGDVGFAVTTDLTSPLTGLVPHQRPLEVVGTFSLGFSQIDETYALIAMQTAADLFNRDGPAMMQLRLERMDDAPAFRERLQEELGPTYDVKDWTQLNQPLYSALWLEKVAISLTIGLIVMVAALKIVASLVLLVMEKSRDIAILRTMGASARVIRRIFIYQGLAIGLLGTGVGTIFGLIVSFAADRYKLITLPSDVYQITYLPFRVEA